jgi:hypothetical protein
MSSSASRTSVGASDFLCDVVVQVKLEGFGKSCVRCAAVDGRHHLAELADTEATVSKCAFDRVPELNVVRKKRLLGMFGH